MLSSQVRWNMAFLALIVLALGAATLGTATLGASRAWAADATAPAGPRIVMIIRHAEKPDSKTDSDLSKQGFARADALAKAIPAHFPKPDYLIATKRSKHSNRPVETLTPLASALNEPIEAKYKDRDCDQLAHELLTDPKFAGKTVLIAWHHGKIPELAKALGATNVPRKWNDEVFDRVWEITYDHGAAHWKELSEDALPGDADKPAATKSEPKPHKHQQGE